MKVLFSPNDQRDPPLWNRDHRNPRRDEVVELMTRFGLFEFVGSQSYPPEYGGQYDLFERTCLILVDVLHFCLNRKDKWVEQTIARISNYQQEKEEQNRELVQSGHLSDELAQRLSRIADRSFDRLKSERNCLETMIWGYLVVGETGPMMSSYAAKLVDLMLDRQILVQHEDRYQLGESGITLLEKLTALMAVEDLIGRSNYIGLSQMLLKCGFDYYEKHPEKLNKRQDS